MTDPSLVAGGPSFWLKADSINGLIDGDQVTAWLDSSGGNQTASQLVSAQKPLYKTNLVNGKPAVRFDGVDDRMTSGVSSSAADQTIIVVYRSAVALGITPVRGGAGGSGVPLLRMSSTSAGAPEVQLDGIGGSGTQGNEGPGTTAFRVWGATFSDTTDTATVFMDGVTTGYTAAATTAVSAGRTTTVGSNNAAGSFANGDLAELLVWNSILSATDRAAVDDYLRVKYAVPVADPGPFVQVVQSFGNSVTSLASIWQTPTVAGNDLYALLHSNATTRTITGTPSDWIFVDSDTGSLTCSWAIWRVPAAASRSGAETFTWSAAGNMSLWLIEATGTNPVSLRISKGSGISGSVAVLTNRTDKPAMYFGLAGTTNANISGAGPGSPWADSLGTTRVRMFAKLSDGAAETMTQSTAMSGPWVGFMASLTLTPVVSAVPGGLGSMYPGQQPVGHSYRVPSAGTTQVISTLATSWAVKQQVTATKATNWAVRSEVAPSTKATNWAVRTSVTATLATNWAVRAQITASLATNWAVRASVTSSKVTNWSVRTQVAASTISTQWAVRGSVLSSLGTQWAVRQAVTITLATNWAVRATVSSTKTTNWAVRQAVTASTATNWAVRQQLTKTTATNWAVRTSVSTTLATSWAVRQQVTATKQTLWNVASALTQVISTLATSWAVRQAILKTSSTNWAVRSTVTKSNATNWAVRQAISSTKLTNWAVRTSVTKTGSTNWAVRGLVTKSTATNWAVRQAVVVTQDTSWATRATVAPSTVTTNWAIRSTTTALLNTEWAIRSGTVSEVNTSWAVLEQIISTVTTRWNVDQLGPKPDFIKFGAPALVWNFSSAELIWSFNLAQLIWNFGTPEIDLDFGKPETIWHLEEVRA